MGVPTTDPSSRRRPQTNPRGAGEESALGLRRTFPGPEVEGPPEPASRATKSATRETFLGVRHARPPRFGVPRGVKRTASNETRVSRKSDVVLSPRAREGAKAQKWGKNGAV